MMFYIVSNCPLTKLEGGLTVASFGWYCCYVADAIGSEVHILRTTAIIKLVNIFNI